MNYNISEIYKTYSSPIRFYLARLVGKDDAEDLTQEVFIKVFNSINTFKGNSKISTWIYKIATNTAIDKLKSFKYKKEKNKLTSLDYIEPLKTRSLAEDNSESNLEYNLFKQEMNHCIADYINKLPENYRIIFLLKEYDNLSFEEISEITGITFDNVKIRLYRAKKKLRELLLKNCNHYYDDYSEISCDKK